MTLGVGPALRRWTAVAGLSVLLSGNIEAFANVTLAEVQERYKNSTVFLAVQYETLEGQTPVSGCKVGSGVLISELGYVATNYDLFTDRNKRPFDKITAVLGKVGESFDCTKPLGDVVKLDR